MTPKAKLFWPAFALSFAADMATKLWVDASLTFADRLTVIDGFFYITHVRNPGAAFGLFNTAPAAVRPCWEQQVCQWWAWLRLLSLSRVYLSPPACSPGQPA